MGGYLSGNRCGGPTKEDGLTLDLYRLLRDGTFRRGQHRAGSIVWTYVSTGERASYIGYQACLDAEDGWVRLTYTVTDRSSGEKWERDYRISLTTTPQPVGGRRWWFVCPHLGILVSKLYLIGRAEKFMSRRAYRRFAYRSQRESPRDRSLGRAFKIRRRLGDDGGIGDFVMKPKWMRHKTFDRHMTRLEAAEDIVEEFTLRLMAGLMENYGPGRRA